MKLSQTHWGQGGVGVDAKSGCRMSPTSPHRGCRLERGAGEAAFRFAGQGSVRLMLSGLVCVVARGWTQVSGPLSGQEGEAASSTGLAHSCLA